MAILLKFEGYPPAVVASVLMHLVLLLFVLGRNVSPSDYVTIEDPVIVTATAVDVNPQRLRRLERIEQEEAAAAQRRQQEQERARREQEQRERQVREARQAREQAEAEQRRQAEAERQRMAEAEAERQRQAEDARRRAAEAAAEEQRREQQRLAQEQAAREAQANQLASENMVVAEYASIIKRIISQNWQIPPGARNGMVATVELRLVPTGEVVGTTIIQSSGDAVFDRSVMQAVARADRFPELQDLDRGLFDRNFRTFTLVFRPEDLLR